MLQMVLFHHHHHHHHHHLLLSSLSVFILFHPHYHSQSQQSILHVLNSIIFNSSMFSYLIFSCVLQIDIDIVFLLMMACIACFVWEVNLGSTPNAVRDWARSRRLDPLRSRRSTSSSGLAWISQSQTRRPATNSPKLVWVQQCFPVHACVICHFL